MDIAQLLRDSAMLGVLGGMARVIFQMGKLVDTVSNHDKRLDRLERINDAAAARAHGAGD
jgi:nitrogenase molybdenum-iron protein alpha/beta subunit